MTSSNQITIGIIGTGRFASVLRKIFEGSPQRFQIFQSSSSKPVNQQTIFPLKKVINCDLVFPAIPISTLETFLKTNSRLLNKNSHNTFVEVCSLNHQPSLWLQKHLPKSVDLVSSHPLFGPISTRNGTDFTGLTFVFWPLRVRNQARLGLLLDHLQNLGLKLVRLKPREHDRLMARSQAVAFLFGHISLHLKLQPQPGIDTPGFNLVLENQRQVAQDSPELAQDMFRFNKEAQRILTQIQIFLNHFQNSTK